MVLITIVTGAYKPTFTSLGEATLYGFHLDLTVKWPFYASQVTPGCRWQPATAPLMVPMWGSEILHGWSDSMGCPPWTSWGKYDLVGADWNMASIFPSIGNNNPNWRTHIFQRGRYTTNRWWLMGSPIFKAIFQGRTWGVGAAEITKWASPHDSQGKTCVNRF